jgi:hypothetical protein
MAEDRPLGVSETAPTPACPKCGRIRQPAAESCPRCGLVFALWKPESCSPIANLDDAGEGLWQDLQDHWDDADKHQAFLKHCLQAGTLAAAGRRYRDRLDAHPSDALAAQMQGQILAKATLGLEIYKTPPRQAVTRSKWFWVVVMTAMALGIAGGLFWRHLR